VIWQFVPDIVRDALAPLFTLFGGTAVLGAAGAIALCALSPIPWLAKPARKAAIVLGLAYAIFAYGSISSANRVRAEWKAANDMIEFVYAERDADNFLKTRAIAEALDAQIENNRKLRKDAQHALRKKLGPGNSRFTRDDIERLREYDRNTAPRR